MRKPKIVGPNVASCTRARPPVNSASRPKRNGLHPGVIREGARVAAWYADRGACSVAPIADRHALGRHRAALLFVAKRDRIARDVVLAVEVERAAVSAGARLVSATGEGNGDSPADAFIRIVLDGAAQYEHGLMRAPGRARRSRRSAPAASAWAPSCTASPWTETACGSLPASESRKRSRGLVSCAQSAFASGGRLAPGRRGTRQPRRARLLPVPCRANAPPV